MDLAAPNSLESLLIKSYCAPSNIVLKESENWTERNKQLHKRQEVACVSGDEVPA
jgi:hypothetical protein